MFYANEPPENPKVELTLYVSSILTNDNIRRLKEFTDYLNDLGGSFNLQTVVYHCQQVLGPDLLKELRVGVYSPLMSKLSADEKMLDHGDPFALDALPYHFRVQGHSRCSGFRSLALGRDCILHRSFVSALYNFVYLLRFISNMSEAWILSLLLARVHDVPDSCLDNARAAVNGVVVNAMRRSENRWPLRPLILPPADNALLSTYYSINNANFWEFTSFHRASMMMYLILASDTSEYVPTELPANILEEYPLGYNTQTRTKLLPKTCGAIHFGTTAFVIPMLSAISAHHTKVLLLPATKECYKFLCGVYGVKQYDGITPMPAKDMIIFESLYQPQMFAKLNPISYRSSDNRTGKAIFNRTASLTEYIPGLEQSDSPKYMVNEFEIPRSNI